MRVSAPAASVVMCARVVTRAAVRVCARAVMAHLNPASARTSQSASAPQTAASAPNVVSSYRLGPPDFQPFLS